MHISGYDPIINETNQTGAVVSVPTGESKRINAYGYDLMLLTSFTSISPLVIAAAGWDDTTDVITSVAHGLQTGVVVQVTTSGALPTGISGSTDYWVIALTDDTFSLASSLANAQAGTAVDFSDAGTGNHTLTQQTDVATYVVEVSPDNSQWFTYDQMSAVSIVGASTKEKHFECAAPYIRVSIAVSKGNLSSVKAWLFGKG